MINFRKIFFVFLVLVTIFYWQSSNLQPFTWRQYQFPPPVSVYGAVGDIGIWRDSAGSQIPGTTFGAFNFATQQRNDGDYSFTGSNTLSLDVAGNYLLIGTLKFTDGSNGRVDYEGRFNYTGSGNFTTLYGSGYSRNNNNNTAWVRVVGLVWGASASDTVQLQMRRDTDTPTLGSIANASHFQVIRLHDNTAVGLYSDTSDTGAYGTTTWTDAPFNNTILENDTTVIQKQAGNVDVRLKKANTTYLIGYGLAFGTGANRTQRVAKMVAGTTDITNSFSYAYLRNGANEYADPNGLFLYRNTGTTTDLSVQAQRGRADSAQSAVRRTNTSGMFVVELPASAEVFISHDSTANQDVGGTNGTFNIMRDIDYSDTDAFIKLDGTAVNTEKDMDAIFLGQVYVERTGTSGTRMTTGSRFVIQDVNQTLGEQGNYLRGNQSSTDTYNAAFTPSGVFGLTLGDDIRVDWFDAGDNGSTDYTIANAVGFSALNVYSLEPTFTQNTYRWYVDNDSTDPTQVWGTPDLAENTSIVLIPASNDPPSSSQELRLRTNLTVNRAKLTTSFQQFKLQYKAGTDGSCTTGTWTDVGAGNAWEYASSTVTDGANITGSLSTTDVSEEYAKSAPTQVNHNSAKIGQDVEYDFHIVGTNSSDSTQYSFRVVESDGTVLDSYNNCPTLITEPATSQLMRHGNMFVNETEQGFFWAD